ncbi:MAG: hypothetical protein WAN43_15745 [Rhodomicrobium sp.]|jgi:hypothetical protein
MASNGATYQAVTLQDGTSAVMRADPAKPQIFEVVATFYETERAQDYAARENAALATPRHFQLAVKARPERGPAILRNAAPKKRAAEKTKAEPETPPDLTERQSAVLKALRLKMDDAQLVEAKAAVLAGAANIPLGSLHSVLQSLEKRRLIRNERSGSAKAPAVYQVL